MGTFSTKEEIENSILNFPFEFLYLYITITEITVSLSVCSTIIFFQANIININKRFLFTYNLELPFLKSLLKLCKLNLFITSLEHLSHIQFRKTLPSQTKEVFKMVFYNHVLYSVHTLTF